MYYVLTKYKKQESVNSIGKQIVDKKYVELTTCLSICDADYI